MTYNHADYIEDAICSFLRQETTFPFKIFIHDDCSTDGTSEIVLRYAKQYPNIIDAVVESQNIYHRDIKWIDEISRQHQIGKYRAFCEGDDYWIDIYKLQKQIEYMERHPNCTISITNGSKLEANTKEILENFDKEELLFAKSNHVITLENFCELKYPPTASYVFRFSALQGIDEDIHSECTAGDIKMRLYSMTKGYCFYFADKTCIYRINVAKSATMRWKKYNKVMLKNAALTYVDLLNDIDRLSNYCYSESIWKMKTMYIQVIIANSNSLSVFRNEEYRKAFSQLKLRNKIRTLTKLITPNAIYEAYVNLRR